MSEYGHIFKQMIETDDPGMCSGTSFYTIEDIYQAIKERLLAEQVAPAQSPPGTSPEG